MINNKPEKNNSENKTLITSNKKSISKLNGVYGYLFDITEAAIRLINKYFHPELFEQMIDVAIIVYSPPWKAIYAAYKCLNILVKIINRRIKTIAK